MLLGKPIREVSGFSSTRLSRSVTGLSRTLRLTLRFVTLRSPCRDHTSAPATPRAQRRQAITCMEFGLFPFRSPLLRESLLFSFPPGTEMVHFPGLAPPSLCIQLGVRSSSLQGFPHSEIRGSQVARHLTAAYRSPLRPSSPLFAKASTGCP